MPNNQQKYGERWRQQLRDATARGRDTPTPQTPTHTHEWLAWRTNGPDVVIRQCRTCLTTESSDGATKQE